MSSAQEQKEPRYYGLYHGVVLDNADPKALGRLTLRVPGVVVESAWAFPFGWTGAGSAQRGGFDVPPTGADVYVMFLGGDPEQPRWTGGNPGLPAGVSEVPTPIQGIDPADAVSVKAYETKRWLLTYDERPGREFFRIEDKISGDKVELDGHAMAMTLQATSSLRIISAGTISLEAVNIQIGGKSVVQNGKPVQ